MKLITLLSCLILTLNANAALEYHSERIKMMDVEMLQQIITQNLKKLANKEADPKAVTKQSLEILLAQPDQSLAASNYFSQLKTYAGGESDFIAVLEEIVNDGISSLKRKGKEKEVLREQNTYLYILNNLINELREFKGQEYYRQLIEKVRDANFDISDSLKSYRLLNSMAQVENPSEFAATVVPKKRPWWKFW